VNYDGKYGCGTWFLAGANAINMAQLWLKNLSFYMAAVAILDFWGYQFCW